MNPIINPLMSELQDKEITEALLGTNPFDTKVFVPSLVKVIDLHPSTPNKDYTSRIRFQVAMMTHPSIITAVSPYHADLLDITVQTLHTLVAKCYYMTWPDIDASVYFMPVDNYGTKCIEMIAVLPGLLRYQYMTLKLSHGRLIDAIFSMLGTIIKRNELTLNHEEQSLAFYLITQHHDDLKTVYKNHTLHIIQYIAEISRRTLCQMLQLTQTQADSSQSALLKGVQAKM